jgi:RimJ/RimL family protein N-acetyltransferase
VFLSGITTARLKIRNLRESDLEAFHLYRSNPAVTRYQGFDVYTLEEAKTFIDQHKNNSLIKPGEWMQFAIENMSTQELVGDCAVYLHLADSRIAEAGITISHLHQRKGYARETLSGIIDYLFTEKGIHRIVETVDAENEASIEMLKSLAFREEGFFRENIFFKGKWGSEYQFAMLYDEWKARRFSR